LSSRPTWRNEFRSEFSVDLSGSSHIDFKRDFSERGVLAIVSRGYWGEIDEDRFRVEVATGFGAQRSWIPRLVGRFSPQFVGTLVTYRLYSIQRRHLIIVVAASVIGVVTVALGIGVIVDSSNEIGGTILVVFGVLLLGSFYRLVISSARIAMAMDDYLIQSLERWVRD
jgi:hypothetical protein